MLRNTLKNHLKERASKSFGSLDDVVFRGEHSKAQPKSPKSKQSAKPKADSKVLIEPKSSGSGSGYKSSGNPKAKPFVASKSKYANYKRIAKETGFRCLIFNTFWFTTHVFFFRWYYKQLTAVTVFVVPNDKIHVNDGRFEIVENEKITADVD